jgi:CRP/FNR family transcriptional regulator, cyclic AMP receptor protein
MAEMWVNMPINQKDLSAYALLELLTPRTREYLAEVIDERVFDTGEVLYKQGDSPAGLYYLKEGQVILYRQSGEKSQVLTLVQVGEYFGGESIANSKPSPCTARVITKAHLLYVEPEDLQVLIQNYPDFLGLFLNIVTQRLRQLTTVVHDLAFRGVSARVAGILLMLAKTSGQPQSDGIHIPHVLSQQEFAAMAGTVREVIYRTLKSFEQQNIVQKAANQYIILDINKLSDIASKELD